VVRTAVARTAFTAVRRQDGRAEPAKASDGLAPKLIRFWGVEEIMKNFENSGGQPDSRRRKPRRGAKTSFAMSPVQLDG
jgi:hypothetical protein